MFYQDDDYPDEEMEQPAATEDVGPEKPRPTPQPRLTQRTLPTQRQEIDEKRMFSGLLPFILQCLPTALSVVIPDTQYDRVSLLSKILERHQGK